VKLTSVQLTLVVSLISMLLISAVIYNYLAKSYELPKMTVLEKKNRFKSLIVPDINEVYDELMEQYQTVASSINLDGNSDEIERLKVKYNVSSDQALLMALKPHPKSIAIAQAAIESAWATSRFFNDAYNVFGVWSFNEDEPRISALEKRGDKTIWLRKYPSVNASIRDYYYTLGTSDAFQEFRQLRLHTDNPFELVKKLNRYSEKGAKYGQELTSIIKFNHFDDYD
jgi:Bax protein